MKKQTKQLAELHKAYDKCSLQATRYSIAWMGATEQIYMCKCGAAFALKVEELDDDGDLTGLYHLSQTTKDAVFVAVGKALPAKLRQSFFTFMLGLMDDNIRMRDIKERIG
jgi:hypothetical protein